MSEFTKIAINIRPGKFYGVIPPVSCSCQRFIADGVICSHIDANIPDIEYEVREVPTGRIYKVSGKRGDGSTYKKGDPFTEKVPTGRWHYITLKEYIDDVRSDYVVRWGATRLVTPSTARPVKGNLIIVEQIHEDRKQLRYVTEVLGYLNEYEGSLMRQVIAFGNTMSETIRVPSNTEEGKFYELAPRAFCTCQRFTTDGAICSHLDANIPEIEYEVREVPTGRIYKASGRRGDGSIYKKGDPFTDEVTLGRWNYVALGKIIYEDGYPDAIRWGATRLVSPSTPEPVPGELIVVERIHEDHKQLRYVTEVLSCEYEYNGALVRQTVAFGNTMHREGYVNIEESQKILRAKRRRRKKNSIDTIEVRHGSLRIPTPTANDAGTHFHRPLTEREAVNILEEQVRQLLWEAWIEP